MMELPIEDQFNLMDLGVDAVILFGSHATGADDKNSDLDFGILLNEQGLRQRHENYHAYYTAVYDVLASRFGDLKGLDVVFLDRAPLELRRHVALYGQVLMEKYPGQVADFNTQSVLLYADFEPYRVMMNQAVLAHI